METTNEIWKPIKGYEGIYEISNLGRVKSLERTTRHGHCLTEKILKTSPNSRGYSVAGLRKRNKQKIFKVHRLVAEAFLPNPENKPEVNHDNGIKTDNRLSNLEWSTQSENVIHAFDKGLRKATKGERHGSSKLTKSDIIFIRANHRTISRKELSKKFNIGQMQISNIVRGKSWTHI